MSRLVLSSARRGEEGKSKKAKGKKGKAESVKDTIDYFEIVALMSRLIFGRSDLAWSPSCQGRPFQAEPYSR